MSLRTRPRLVIGPWQAGADLREGEPPSHPSSVPSAPPVWGSG